MVRIIKIDSRAPPLQEWNGRSEARSRKRSNYLSNMVMLETKFPYGDEQITVIYKLHFLVSPIT